MTEEAHENQMTQAGSARSAGWRGAVRGNVLSMGLVSLFTDFSSEMMNPLLPIYVLGLVAPGPGAVKAAVILVGLMEGIAETTASLLKIFSGRLSDVLGKRKALVVVGYGLSSVSRPLIALAGAVWHVIALKFADRVGKGLRTSPRDALIGDSVGPSVRGLAFSFHRTMDHVGAVLGPLVAVGVLYALLGEVLWKGATDRPSSEQMRALSWLFAIAVVPGVLAMAAVLRVREIAPPGRPEPASPTAAEGPAPSVWRELPRKFYLFVSIVTLFALGNSSDMFIVFLGSTRFGMSVLEVVILWVALHVSKIAFSIPGGIVSDKMGRRPVLVAGWIVYALVYLGLGFADQAWHLWTLIVVYGLYYGLSEGVEKALVTDFIPSRHRSTAFGIYHGAVGVAALPASLIFGAVWSAAGAWASFALGAAMAGVAAVLLAVLLARGGDSKEA